MKKLIYKMMQLVICALAAMAIAMFGYGLYQQSQLYPLVHQEIGKQAAIQQIQAQMQAQQQAMRATKQLSNKE